MTFLVAGGAFLAKPVNFALNASLRPVAAWKDEVTLL
jgi:hypothetical protein